MMLLISPLVYKRESTYIVQYMLSSGQLICEDRRSRTLKHRSGLVLTNATEQKKNSKVRHLGKRCRRQRDLYICLTLTPTHSLMVYNVNPKCIIAFIVSSRPHLDTPANDSVYLMHVYPLQGFVKWFRKFSKECFKWTLTFSW